MKKIYMILAAITLLSLSLNAQRLDVNPDNVKLQNVQNNNAASFINQLRGTKGVSSIMPEIYDGTPAQGLLRAPLRINSDEVTVGPFTGDNFSQSGLGFGNAYPDPQMVLIETDLLRNEYVNYIGEEIVGFRLALAGDATRTVQVGEFIAWPMNSNGAWEQDNRYTWSIGELTTPAGNPYYEKVTSTSGLESGEEYLIVYENDNVAFNGGLTTLDVGNNVISVNRNGTIIESNATTDAATFTITANGNYYTIRSKSGYYIGRTSSSNGMNTNANSAYNNSITFSNNNVVIRGRGTTNNNTYYLRFNSSSGNDNYRFRYYAQTSQQNIQLYKKVTPTAPAYVALQDGQWHEFYLDNPVTFNVGSDNAGLSLGYTYVQYPTGTTGQNLFPIAVNPQSTTHDHYAYLTTTTAGNGDIIITVPSYNTMFQTITVTDNNTGRTLTSWSSAESTVTDGTYEFYQMPTGWTLSGVYMFTYTTSGYTFGYLSSENQASITISSSLLNGSTNVSVAIAGAALEEGQYVDVNGDSRSLSSGYLFNQTWNPVDLSGGSTTSTGYNYYDFSQYGDLAVQLIFKSKLPKTDPPVISVTPGDATYTITATAADPDATVTLTVDGVEYTGTGSVSVTVDRGTTDKNVDVSATAQKGDLLESDPATQIVTVPALPITPTPTITYDTTNATVVVTATGDGTVYLEVDGQVASGEGSVSITIMRSIEDRTVTATATAVDDNHQPSAEASREVPVPALNGTPSTVPEGLLRMHLLVVDQLKEEIPDDNSHPDRYGYVLKWEQPANADDRKQSGTVEVDIQKTEAQVNGYYTLDQIDADVNIGINHDQGLTMDVLTADVGMFLPGENPDVLYYQMQGKQGEDPELNEDYLTQLQYMKNVQKYEEMLATSPNKTHQYPANETYHYYDDSTPIVTGIYNDPTSFITYAPSVSTWGIQRRYFEDDGLDNTYGAPIWKTAVGKVELKSAVHERQKNSWNSVNWTDAGGNACSLYILKDIVAEGYLPHTGISNVEYEPYMFRVFVESKNGKLRPYTIVPQGDGDYDGEHLVAGEGTTTGPLCVWSGYCMDGDVNGMTFSEGPSETVSGQTKYTFTKAKVDRDDISNPWLDYDTIKDPETGEVIDIVLVNDRNAANAMFGALDNLAEIIGTDDQGKPIYATVTEDDLKVFVRFYYVAAGTADGHTLNTRAGGASYPAGYGTESPGKAPSPWTSVNELQYHGEIVGQTYYNVQGMQSDRPFEGVNIIVTRYSDGSTSVSKVVK